MFQDKLVSLVDSLIDGKYFGQIGRDKKIQFVIVGFLDSVDIYPVDLSHRSCSFLKYKYRIEGLVGRDIDGTGGVTGYDYSILIAE